MLNVPICGGAKKSGDSNKDGLDSQFERQLISSEKGPPAYWSLFNRNVLYKRTCYYYLLL